MGLRAASVGHSDASVMAPALTKVNQRDNFKLTDKTTVNGHSRNSGGCSPLLKTPAILMCKELNDVNTTSSMVVTTNGGFNNADNFSDALENLNTLAFVSSEIVKVNGHNKTNPQGVINTIASDLILAKEEMGDKEKPEIMGLHAPQKEMAPPTLKEAKQTMADVDQLIHNVIQGNELPGDLGTNVDEFIQVLNNMESEQQQDTEISFPINTVNLQSFCSNLLGDVSVLRYEDEIVVDQEVVAKEMITQERIYELTRTHNKLERRYEFLLRRLQKLQTRNMAKHVSSEVAGLYELTYRFLKRAKQNEDEARLEPSTSATVSWPVEDKPKGLSTVSVKNLVHKLEKTKSMQSNALFRNKTTPRYFGAGSVEVTSSAVSNVCRNNCVVVPNLGPQFSKELERVSGLLETEVGIMRNQLDSDATASSSGAESCDEMQNFNNPHQQYCTM